MTASPVTAYLSIGSNIGDRLENLRQACRALNGDRVDLLKLSSVYETEPVDVLEQDWFLNCAAAITTTLSPQALLDEIHAIERKLGRIREIPKGPRTIDIDILLYSDTTLDSPTLLIPHPRMFQRRFVLTPLAEIAPQLRVPPGNETISELLMQLKDESLVHRFGELDVPS